jgi:hypothetical protein
MDETRWLAARPGRRRHRRNVVRLLRVRTPWPSPRDRASRPRAMPHGRVATRSSRAHRARARCVAPYALLFASLRRRISSTTRASGAVASMIVPFCGRASFA